MLVVAQIAISLLMLIAAGLFVRTLANLESVPLGFDRENLLLFKLNARMAGHRDPEIAVFYSELLKRVGAIPGVRKASLSNSALIGGRSLVPPGSAGWQGAGSCARYPHFECRTRLLRHDENPLGKRILFEKGRHIIPREIEIVGIAQNTRYGALKGSFPPTVYVPFNQDSYVRPEEATFALRTSGDPFIYVNSVREIVRQADSRIPVTHIKSQAVLINQTIDQEIIFARLCTVFALLALLSACVGLYGAMAYSMARRTSEIGIRMALGAERRAVVWMVLRDVGILAAIGLGISVPAALGASKLLESFLFGMKPNDPGTILLAIAVLLSAALLAGYLPERRASRIDPMNALRHE